MSTSKCKWKQGIVKMTAGHGQTKKLHQKCFLRTSMISVLLKEILHWTKKILSIIYNESWAHNIDVSFEVA